MRSLTPNSLEEAIRSINSALEDTGARVEYPSGAMREVYPGKGRHGLMPFNVIAELYRNKEGRFAFDMFRHLHQFVTTKETIYLYIILEKFLEAHYDNSFAGMLLDLGIHYEDGAAKYGDRNWEKGLPVGQCLDSATRHLIQYFDNRTDEPHHRAFLWNIIAILYMFDVYPDSELLIF